MTHLLSGRKQSREHVARRVAARRRNGTNKHTEEAKLRMSVSHIGLQAGENHPLWKGDSVGYFSLHSWVGRNFKKPDACEECGTKDSPKFNWSMNHETFSRLRKDWRWLCRKCHILYDKIWVNRSRNQLGQFVS